VQLQFRHWCIQWCKNPARQLKCVCLLLCALCLHSSQAWSAGLGNLTLHSSLGQLLDAEIEISVADAIESETLQAYMASQEVFEQMGIPQVAGLADIRFAIESRSKNDLVLKVTSIRPVREPFINIVVELAWATGTYLREYTFLLDPVINDVAAKPLQQGSSAPVDDIVIVSGESVTSEAVVENADSPEIIIVVKRGDNLLDIARTVKPAGVSIEQVAMAIYDRNPRAFYGSVHQLNRGAELLIPDPQQMQSRSVAGARKALSLTGKTKRSTSQVVQNNPKLVTNTAPASQESIALQAGKATGANPDKVPTDGAKSVAAVASNITRSRAEQTEPSLSALRVLIQDLRTALLGLGKELEVKSTQLEGISQRVDKMQQRQADAAARNSALSNEVVGAAAALKKIPGSRPDNESVNPATDSQNPSSGELRSTNTAQESSALVGSESETQPDTMSVPALAGKDAQPPNKTNALAENNIEPPNTQDELALPSTTASTPEDIKPTVDSSALSVPTQSTSSTTSTSSATITGKDEGMFAWFLDPRRNRQIGNRLRDAGLLALAVLLGYVLLRRMFSDLQEVNLDIEPSVVNADSMALELSVPPTTNSGSEDVVNPLSAIEYFREQLSGEQRREHTLKEMLSEEPARHDVRLDLLRVYYQRGAQEQFAQTAREMYAIAKGKNKEWHEVIKMGLDLDPDMAFYYEPGDHGFTLSDEFAVEGMKTSSVSAGRSVTGQTASLQSGSEARNNRVRPDSFRAQASNDDVVDSNHSTSSPSSIRADDTLKNVHVDDVQLVDIELGDAANTSAANTTSGTTIEYENKNQEAYLDEAALDDVVWNNTGQHVSLDEGVTPNAQALATQTLSSDSTFDQIAKLESLNQPYKADTPATSSDAVNSEAPTHDEPEQNNAERESADQAENSGVDYTLDVPAEEASSNSADDTQALSESSNVNDSLEEPTSTSSNSVNASPAEDVPSWKYSEVRLDLAAVYIDLGNFDGARVLLDEVIQNGDASQIEVAQKLLKKIV